MKYALIIIAVIALITFIASCTKETTQYDYSADNEQAILDYLAANNINATPTGSGLYYNITKTGNGSKPTLDKTVYVYYNGYKPNGSVFDSNLAPKNPISFPLSNLILGWQEGIPLLSVGGSAQLFIPAHLAYGSRSPSSNGILIFDIELVNFN